MFAGTGRTAEPVPIRIVTSGDLMLGSWIEQTVRQNGWDYPFANLDSILTDADIVFANLEAPLGKGGVPYEKTYTFQVSPDLVDVLHAGKVNMVSLANNHILDYGGDVLGETLNVLKKNWIFHSGAGANLHEARKPAIMQVNGKRIAVASYSLTFPEEFWATDSTPGTCFPHHTFYYDDIRKFKQENDLLIVSFHWGAELMTTPKEYQVKLAHRTINAGADLIVGHHPHVIQGIEIYKGKIIAYSLGNYIFGSYSEKVRESMLLKFFYGTNGIEKCRIYPMNVYNKETEFQPRLLQNEQKTSFFNKLQEISQELNQHQNVVSNGGWILF